MEHLNLTIDGMSCGHCVARVEKALRKLDGVNVNRVEIGSADLTYDPARTPFARIREALDDAGYTARPVERAGRLA
ncbi:MAG TPA: heavy-metal-associated domain-containing protein [Thermoanaerobaculia bacterium]|jgi:copper chaperone CopZ